MTINEKMRIIRNWTHNFVLNDTDGYPSLRRTIGRIKFNDHAFRFTSWFEDEEDVVDDAYNIIRDRVWGIVMGISDV